METDSPQNSANIASELTDSHPKVNPEFAQTVQRETRDTPWFHDSTLVSQRFFNSPECL